MKQDICTPTEHLCRFPVAGSQCQIIDGSSIPTFVINRTHVVLIWNRACEHVTGVSSREVIGGSRQWAAFYPSQRPVLADLIVDGADDEEISRHYGTTWRRSAVIPGAYESEDFYPDLGSDGLWLFFSAAPLVDGDGRVIGAIETLQDVSERKHAEAAVREHRENLEALVRQRTEELEQANQELSQYAFVVSHDLRAPLRAIRNYTGFLCEDLAGIVNVEQQRYLDGIRTALRHGDALVSDILDYSRISSMPIRLEPIEMDRFLCGLIADMQLGPDVRITIAGDMPAVAGEKTALRQIFVNLISNGLKFNRSGQPSLEISACAITDTCCEIAVSDNGIGIDPRYQERVFKMFKRLHTHREFDGTGIGLAIVQKAVFRLNGSVRLKSQPGEGSTFYVVLPLAGTLNGACAHAGTPGGVP